MTTIDPYYISVDGHILATYANALEAIEGTENIPGQRMTEQYGAFTDGSYPPVTAPTFYREKHLRLRLWVAPYNADGAVTATNGPRAHLRANVEALFKVLANGKPDKTVDWIVPTATGTKTLRNFARVTAGIENSGSTRLVRRMLVDFTFPFPFWRDTTTGLISVGPTGSNQQFTPGGTAPHVDMLLTCHTAGRITHAETGDFVEAASGFTTALAINLRDRTVTHGGGDGRFWYNANRPWGLRLPAGVQANLTVTGSWTIARYNLEH